MHGLGSDLRYAFRTFSAGKLVALSAVGTIAVSIGLATATYTVVEAVLLRALPFSDPQQLVIIKQSPLQNRARGGGATSSALSVETIRRDNRTLVGVATYSGSEPIVTGLGDPERIRAWSVSSNLFPLLGVRPLFGRNFGQDDDRPGSAATAILSYSFWSSRFGRDQAVLGRTIVLGGRAVEIVGVMPKEITYPPGALWSSLGWTLTPKSPGPAGPQGGYWILGRLKPGITRDDLRTDLDQLMMRLATTQPAFKGWVPNATPIRDDLVGTVRGPLLVILGAVGFVLLVGCANVANLLLARGVERQKELAIRVALGASRSRVLRQLFTESLFLALTGGALGVLMAVWGVPALVSVAGTALPAFARIDLNVNVLALSLATMVGAALLFGLGPALRTVSDVSGYALHDPHPYVRAGSTRLNAGEFLAVVQVALTLMLLTGAGLLGTTFVRLMRVDADMEPGRIVMARFALPRGRYPNADAAGVLTNDLLERVRGVAGVTHASISNGTPLDAGMISSVSIPQRENSGGSGNPFTGVTPDYFQTFGIALKRGRLFEPGRRENDSVVVNETLARKYFPGEDPIGRRIVPYDGSPEKTIVGVVSDRHQFSLVDDPRPEVYEPFPNSYFGRMIVSVQAHGDVAGIARSLRGVIHDVDSRLFIDKIETMQAVRSASVSRQRFYAVLMGTFAVSTLLLAAAGIFALMMFAVTRRTREIGIRMALGAERGDVLALLLSRVSVIMVVGIIVGLLGSAMVTRGLEALLFGVRATDPVVFGLCAALLASVGAIASLAPAYRAASIDPRVAIGSE